MIDVLNRAAPAADEQERSRYFLLIAELAHLGEEAEKETPRQPG
jgi:hypothetical protein